MQINSISSTNFNGMWGPVKVLTHEEGVCHKNRHVYKLYDMVYHPWVDESKEAVQEQVDKYFFGRNFHIMDINAEDFHFKEVMYEMNRVKVGEPIRHEDEAKLYRQGYNTKVIVGTPSDERFSELYPNPSFAAMDVTKMKPERITELANTITWNEK